jgi:glycosyltransferase involved in cell wall biosynthesis
VTAQTSDPLVSAIMPVFNNERYLDAAVQGILDQTFGDFEFIIVDDGSTDRSTAILREFARRDRRIKLLLRDHRGLVRSLNEAIEHARGRFIARMDADDISLPERFAVQVKHMEKHPDDVLVGSRVLLIDPDGAPICEFARETNHEEIEAALYDLRWPIVHPSIMLRRDILQEIGGYRRQYETLEDVDMYLRLGERGRLANVPQVLLHYRQHGNSICHLLWDRQNAIREKIFQEACGRRGTAVLKASGAFIAARRPPEGLSQRWAWLALKAGNVSTARKHALRTVRRQPVTLDSWRVLFCAMRGH